FALFASLLVASAMSAEQSALDRANAAMNASDYTAATKLYEQATKAEPGNGAAWEGLGNASLKSGKFDDAHQAYSRAVELKWRPYLNQMNLARVAAKQGKNDEALTLLHALAATGKAANLRGFLQTAEFGSLRSSPEFQRVSEEMKPCRSAE